MTSIPVYPIKESNSIIENYGFSFKGYCNYTLIRSKPNQQVHAILSGFIEAGSDYVKVSSPDDISIIYSGINPSVPSNLVEAGSVIGYANGTEIKIVAEQSGMYFDFIGRFFPDKSNLLQHNSKEPVDTNIMSYFIEASNKYDINLKLLLAVADEESGFNSSEVSNKGAIGVMQLMPGTIKELNVTNPYDPEQNILGGARYLKGLLERYRGNIDLALAAYNAGTNSVDKYNGIPPYAETINYVTTVDRLINKF